MHEQKMKWSAQSVFVLDKEILQRLGNYYVYSNFACCINSGFICTHAQHAFVLYNIIHAWTHTHSNSYFIPLNKQR